MKIQRTLRAFWRMILLGWVILSGFAIYFIRHRDKGESGRIAWMQWMSRRFLALMHCRVERIGMTPVHGLIVCNHLGYVDVLVIGSLCPALFVAKSDVQGWPVFGWLTRLAGTLFVERQSRTGVNREIHTINSRLSSGFPVVIFPEGTSSDGSRVLPFRSSFFQALHDTDSSVTPAAICYDLHGAGDAGQEIAYWGEMILIPHLFNILSKKSFKAVVCFGETHRHSASRKEDADLLHAEVSQLLTQVQGKLLPLGTAD